MENSQQFGNFYHRADKPMKMVLRLVVIVFMVIIGWNVITGKHGKFLGWEYNIPEIPKDIVQPITSPVINQPKVETKGSVKNQNNGINNGTIGDTYVHPGQIAIHYADETVANIIVSPQLNAVSY